MASLEELLSVQWNGDRKMVEHCLKHCLYIQLGDTFIRVGDRKPSIDRDLWYDDETDGPAETFENFKAYNMRTNAPRLIDESHGRELYVTVNYNGDRTNGKLLALTTYDVDNRLATDEEIALANNALSEARADYEKRLAAYWKRYSSKVHARGYYVNR